MFSRRAVFHISKEYPPIPSTKHFASSAALCSVTAAPTAGVVTYHLDGVATPGPNLSFHFGNNAGDVRRLSIMFVAPGGSTCPVKMQFDGQTDFDFLSAVTGAPPDIRDHDFVTAASASDVTEAVRFRTFQLTGRSTTPKKKKAAKKARKVGAGK